MSYICKYFHWIVKFYCISKEQGENVKIILPPQGIKKCQFVIFHFDFKMSIAKHEIPPFQVFPRSYQIFDSRILEKSLYLTNTETLLQKVSTYVQGQSRHNVKSNFDITGS